jgi:arylsulfatase A-like enzyme
MTAVSTASTSCGAGRCKPAIQVNAGLLSWAILLRPGFLLPDFSFPESCYRTHGVAEEAPTSYASRPSSHINRTETIMQWKKAAAAIGCALTLALSGCGGSDSAKAPPNILVILADDLGYSDIGAFGGEISTPNLDALVASGRVLTNYHTGATCSPARAMLMSGADHHSAGLGNMAEIVGASIATNAAPWGASNTYGLANVPDGYVGFLSQKVVAMPQFLKDAGYHTYMAGKWHLGQRPASPAKTGGAPFEPYPASYPKARGFERSFALVQGAGSHFAPVPGKPTMADLLSSYVEDDQPVSLPANFYSSESYTDKLISYLDLSSGDGKPFLAYLAYTAPHWPLQAPDADIAKYAGKYDEGYEVIRARRIARQKSLGIIPADFNPNAGLDTLFGRPRWSNLTDAQKASEARKMEVYAAMIDNMDRNIGRLIQHLKDSGRYDNTMVVFMSDNGAEGSPTNFANNANTDNSLGNIGRRLSNVAYGERWAEVSATPFRLWKAYLAEGGVSAPMIVHLPGQAAQKPAMDDLAHVSDLLPTFLELAGVANPGTMYKGAPVELITGVSLLARLQDRTTSPPRGSSAVLADEFSNGRYVIRDSWKLVSIPAPFGNNSWQLFDLNADRAESIDVLATHSDLASQLMAEYDAYAARVGVVPTPLPWPRSPAP